MGQIELSQFATITEGSGPSKLERQDSLVTVQVTNMFRLELCVTQWQN
jgi:multidrug efflux pump subunit AcrB